MKNVLLKILIIVIGIQFTSCTEEINTESYYVKKPSENQEILHFFSIESKESQFWNISRSEKNGYIITKRLNSKNELIDEITEKITENGSKLISYIITDKTGEFPAEIKFYPKDKDLIKWNLNEISVYSGEYIRNGVIFEFKRTRKFLKRENDQLIFRDNYEFKPLKGQITKNLEWLYENNFSQTSYFERNTGLVKYERIYKKGEKETFERKK